jgi:hypothetical protein
MVGQTIYAAVITDKDGNKTLSTTVEGLLAITDNKKQLQKFANRVNIMAPDIRCTVEKIRIQLDLQ